MGWSIGYDSHWQRDIGYGVPATCDYPGCGARIDRGLSYVCGGLVYGGDVGCGLFFCERHRQWDGDREAKVCDRCLDGQEPFDPTPDVAEWTHHKATHPTWAQWRAEHGAAAAARHGNATPPATGNAEALSPDVVIPHKESP